MSDITYTGSADVCDGTEACCVDSWWVFDSSHGCPAVPFLPDDHEPDTRMNDRTLSKHRSEKTYRDSKYKGLRKNSLNRAIRRHTPRVIQEHTHE